MGFIVNTSIPPVRNTSATLISTNDVFEKGRILFETDTNRGKVGDGVTTYTNLTYPEWTYEEVAAAGTDTYTATFSKDILLVYFNMMRLRVKFTNANTGASTININGLGAIAIRKNVSTALSAGDIVAGGIYDLTYDGTNFQMLGTAGGVSSSIWSNSKYWLESGDSATVPSLYQHLYSNELINDGEITNDGEIIEI